MKKFLVVLLLLSPSAVAVAQCGKERWPVKTLIDSDVKAINQVAKQVTVEDLLALQAPTRKQITAAKTTRFEDEKQTYVLVANIVGFKLEADSDFHVVIASLVDPKKTMVVEFVSPDCVTDPQVKAEFRTLRQNFEAWFGYARSNFRVVTSSKKFRITGIGFYDFIHGQKGVAPNGIELHPVTAVEYNLP